MVARSRAHRGPCRRLRASTGVASPDTSSSKRPLHRELSTVLPTGNWKHETQTTARGRSVSQRVLAHRARSSAIGEPQPELVVPHQLAKFASASNLVVSQRASASGQMRTHNQQSTTATTSTTTTSTTTTTTNSTTTTSYDERLLYSREGVYMGPGALYSWQPFNEYPSSVRGPSSGGTSGAGGGKAQALLAGSGQAASNYPSPKPACQLAATTDPATSSNIHCHCRSHLSSLEWASTTTGLTLTTGVRSDSMYNFQPPNRAEAMLKSADGIHSRQAQPPAAISHQLQTQTAQKQAKQAHRSVWLTSLTQRVHPPLNRDNNNNNNPKRQQFHHHHHQTHSRSPKLSKETRSNSLTGPFCQQGYLYHRGNEVSKSSLELAQRNESVLMQDSIGPGRSCELSQARRDLERLLLKGSDCNQNQQHQLLLESARCSLNEPARTYGINLISSCVHCQLIAELACNRGPSAYLEQLLPDQLRWQASVGESGGEPMVPIYPSVVLTVCSKQTTLEETAGAGEEQLPTGMEQQEEEEPEQEQHSTSSDSSNSFEGTDDEEEDEESSQYRAWREDLPRWSSLNSLASSDSVGDFNLGRASSQSSGGELTDPEERQHRRHKASYRRRASAANTSRQRRRMRRATIKTTNAGNKQKITFEKSPVRAVRAKEHQQNVGSSAVLLEVPTQGTKQTRSASLDEPYLLKVPSGASCEHSNSPHTLENIFDETLPASKSSRSRSVDIALPACPGDSYQLMRANTNPVGFQASLEATQQDLENQNTSLYALTTPASSNLHLLAGYQKKKFIQGEIKVACANGETRALKLFVDWHGECINGEHLWTYAGSSSDACYVGESECLKHGARLSCSACKIMAHTGCISILIDKIKFICKHTFKDLTVNNPRHLKELQQENVIYHHWIHKRTLCGRCKQCSKTFGNTKLSFSSKEIQAITCSWCKVSYHNKENCYTLASLTEPCTLGAHRESIIPPTWIVKLPPNNSLQQQQLSRCNQSTNQTKLCNSPVADTLTTTTTIKNSNDNLCITHDSVKLVDGGQLNENLNARLLLSSSSQPIYSPDLSEVNVYSLDQHSSTTNNYKTTSSSNDNSLNNTRLKQGVSDPKDVLSNTTGDSLMSQIEDMNQSPTRHPQESTNQYQKHQLKQYYKQLDVGLDQMTNQTKFGDSHTDLRMSDLHRKQQHQSTTDYSENSSDFYQNFRIIPQPIHGAPNAGSKPVLVFVNPRSGGNQGAKMMHKFNWLLNPRQVFDLIHSGGPKAALNLYRDVPNLRILTIGGDGTASWILSYLDEVGVPNKIPVAVLPLGTGNDLARALGWGGGYADEPIAKILAQVRDGEIVQLDRWNIHVERNSEATPSSPNEFSSSCYASSNLELNSPSITSSQSYFGPMSQNVNHNNINTSSTLSIIDQTNCDTNMLHGTHTNAFSVHHDEQGVDRLPMDVINNYFSFGVDAHIALEFHLAREAHPERFNSRLRNKMFYGQAGGKDLLKRKWKDLSNFVTLYCDGVDITGRLKELKVHSVLFLNIPSYGGGTRPWPTTTTSAFTKPRTDDGLIEVIGLTTYQLPLLQAGGHGTCIAQCKRAKIITSRTIPMQVDGEPCKLLPSILNISFKNQVCMLAKSKNSSKIDPDITEV